MGRLTAQLKPDRVALVILIVIEKKTIREKYKCLTCAPCVFGRLIELVASTYNTQFNELMQNEKQEVQVRV